MRLLPTILGKGKKDVVKSLNEKLLPVFYPSRRTCNTFDFPHFLRVKKSKQIYPPYL